MTRGVTASWGGLAGRMRRVGRDWPWGAGPRRWLSLLADRWRRSLQLRVVTATLVLSAVVVTVLGYALMQRFVTDLYANKQKAAANVMQAGLSTASQNPQFRDLPGSSAPRLMCNLAKELTSGGTCGQSSATTGPGYGQGGAPYAVVVTLPKNLQGPTPDAPDPATGVYSGGEAVGFHGRPQLPASLVSAVEHALNKPPQYIWTSMAVGSNATPVHGLLIGASFGNRYELYYFFPVTAEQASIAGMQRAMLLVGVAAVFLLVAIAWLVTRWVVSPVRLAAQGARRLSEGNLDERMDVRGTDELAALATSFNEMAASLQDKLLELEDLSQVQRQFVSDVSHELRTPLTTIRIAADVLFSARHELSAAPARSAELLQSQLERFEELLTDLLEISRYDANVATLDAEPTDVCTIVRQSADVAQQLAERRGSRIAFRLPAEACIAEVDRRRVERILRNLLVNAVEHGEDVDVVVTVAADSAAVAVSVRDFGVGLSPGEEQLVFERFWRADPARARTSGGTGLGLAIALEDARLHGGWLEAWGECGRGSVFRLTLPRAVGGELHGSPLPLRPDHAVDTGPLRLNSFTHHGAGGGPPAQVASGDMPPVPDDPSPARPSQVPSHG